MRADLSITRNSDGLAGTLRADRIRRDTLTQLAAALRGDNSRDVQDRLDDLIDAIGNPRDTGGAEIDALVEALESEAGMDAAAVDLTAGDLGQLARQSADAVNALAPVLRPVPSQQDRRAS